MTENQDSNLRLMTKGIARAIRASKTDLEKVTNNLNASFKGLNVQDLPEYKAAINAIKAYESALIAHFSKKYKESR